jgi:hypothetical protein
MLEHELLAFVHVLGDDDRSSTALAISPIRPTDPPPNTRPIPFSAMIAPNVRAAFTNAGSEPGPDPQYTQILLIEFVGTSMADISKLCRGISRPPLFCARKSPI